MPLVRWCATVFVVAVACNFAWEMAQSYLYEPMGDWWQSTRRCLIASVGDAVMVVLIAAVVRGLSRKSPGDALPWSVREYMAAMTLGFALAVVVEWWGLTVGRWAYRPEMPIVPGTPFGIVPLVQMVVLTPLTMWLAQRSLGVRR